MSIATEITRLQTAKADLKTAIESKGVTVAASATLDDYADLVDAIETGGGDVPHELPSGYTQLKYIESSGTQIIDTGVKPTIETEVQIQFFYLQAGTYNGYSYPTGCLNPGIALGVTLGFNSTYSYFSFGDKQDFQSSAKPYAPSDTVPTFCLSKTSATIKQSPFTDRTWACGATTMSGSDATTIAIFGRNNAGTYERKIPIRFFREKIYESGTLIRDFVPALKDSTSVIGLYDIAGNTFYENAGTGVFTGEAY